MVRALKSSYIATILWWSQNSIWILGMNFKWWRWQSISWIIKNIGSLQRRSSGWLPCSSLETFKATFPVLRFYFIKVMTDLPIKVPNTINTNVILGAKEVKKNPNPPARDPTIITRLLPTRSIRGKAMGARKQKHWVKNYSDITWASLRPRLSTVRLCVQ